MQLHLTSHSLATAGGLSARKVRGNFPFASEIVWRMYLLSNYNIPWKGGNDDKKVKYIYKLGHYVRIFSYMTSRVPFQPVSIYDFMILR